MTPLLYVPSSFPLKRDEWPTLGEMIQSGKRVVAFLDKGANGTDSDQPLVDFILPQFKMVPFRDLSLPSHTNNHH